MAAPTGNASLPAYLESQRDGLRRRCFARRAQNYMKSAACLAEQMLTDTDSQPAYYPIVLDFEYYVLDHTCIVAAGTGKTAKISSRAILFESATHFASGTVLQIIAQWPVLREGKEVLRWIVQGTVVGQPGCGTLLIIEHERLVRPAHEEATPEPQAR